jgi:hypothetical protein
MTHEARARCSLGTGVRSVNGAQRRRTVSVFCPHHSRDHKKTGYGCQRKAPRGGGGRSAALRCAVNDEILGSRVHIAKEKDTTKESRKVD